MKTIVQSSQGCNLFTVHSRLDFGIFRKPRTSVSILASRRSTLCGLSYNSCAQWMWRLFFQYILFLAHARHIRSVLQSSSPSVLFIERTFYDRDHYINNYDAQNRPISLGKSAGVQDGGNDFRLKERSKEFYHSLMLNNNLEEDEQIVTMETSFACFLDDQTLNNHCENFSVLIIDRIRSW